MGFPLPLPFQVLIRRPVEPESDEERKRREMDEFINPTSWPHPQLNSIGRFARGAAEHVGLLDKPAEPTVRPAETIEHITEVNDANARRSAEWRRLAGQVFGDDTFAFSDGHVSPTWKHRQNATEEWNALMAAADPSSVYTPEERMIDTHMDNQRSIIAKNNAAREGRRSYSPDAESERRKTLARTRNKRTGQVDELSNLGGGRGAMLIRLANENRQDLSTPEGRRAAFGPAPTTDPAQAGPQLGDWTGRTELSPHQLRGVAPGATISSETGRVISGVGTPERERRLNRKKDVGEYYNKLASAAPNATDAASQGISLADALRGVPPSARRAARNAYIAEQQRQRATERTVQIAEAQAGGGPAGPALDRRVGPLLAVLENPHSTPQQKEHANRMLMAIVAGMQP